MREDDSISRDVKEVLTRWHKDISNLYAGLREESELVFDDEFYQDILRKRLEFDQLEEEHQERYSNIQYNNEGLNDELSFQEVSDAIDKVKNGKAYLSIPNDALKSYNAKRLLHQLFNLCFWNGMNPSAWNYSNIIPIPKPDKDSRDPLQNRCISILCCVAKVYSSILNRRVQSYLEKNNILVDEQNDFRSSRSCIDHIYVLVTILRNRKEQGKDTFLAFIDFKKAFDTVERNLLFFKLAAIGINGKIYKAIASLYSNPMSRVVLEGFETEYFRCPIGVKQGDSLSPTLFSIFVNDLAMDIKDAGLGINLEFDASGSMTTVSLLLYADDIVCLGESEMDLQSILVIVESWCRKWQLEVNLSKTNILHVRKARKLQSKFCFLFNNRPVPYCNSYKYLGVSIDQHLNFSFSVEKQAEAAEGALSSIITKMIKNNGFPFTIFSMLYDMCVSTISDYSAAVMGYSEYQSLQKVHLRAIRAFLGVPKNAPNPGVLSEVDWLLPTFRTRVSMIRHYHRMINMDNSRLTKKVFLWDKKLNIENRIETWYSEIGNIFHDCNLDLLYNLGVDFDIKFTCKYIKSKYAALQSAELSEKCSLLPKLRTFMLLKDFTCEPVFIKKPLTFILRRLIARIRLGCLPLRLETGRFAVPRLPEEKRKCLVCAGDGEDAEIESESHFLFRCTAYESERDKWVKSMTLPPGFNHLQISEKLKIVLNESCNIKPTAIFIDKSLSLRDKALKLV